MLRKNSVNKSSTAIKRKASVEEITTKVVRSGSVNKLRKEVSTKKIDKVLDNSNKCISPKKIPANVNYFLFC
jgi:hypothetical protein